MSRHPLLVGIVVVGLTVALLQFLAIRFYLYWAYIWLDLPMHFLGGVFVALLALWFVGAVLDRLSEGVAGWRRTVRTLFLYPFARLSAGMLFVTLSVLVIGIGWELFELATGLLVERNYVFDTSLDLLMDVLGGLTAVLLLARFIWPASAGSHV